jgi:hypothetical protein
MRQRQIDWQINSATAQSAPLIWRPWLIAPLIAETIRNGMMPKTNRASDTAASFVESDRNQTRY